MKLMENNISTAEEFLNQEQFYAATSGDEYEISQAMIEFAKLHVAAALKEASENAIMEAEPHEGKTVFGKEFNTDNVKPYIITVDKRSILNSYPLTNIK